MKYLLKIVFFLLLPIFVTAQFQKSQLDSMYRVLRDAVNDTIRMDACFKMEFFYDNINLDSSVYYAEKGISIAKQLKLKLNEAEMLMGLSFPLTKMQNYPLSFKVLMQALEITENPANEKNTWLLKKWQTPQTYRLSILGYTHLGLGFLYAYSGNYEKQVDAYYKGKRIAESIKDSLLIFFIYENMSSRFNEFNQLDSALFYGLKAMEYCYKLPYEDRKYGGGALLSIGLVYEKRGNFTLARENYERAVQLSEELNSPLISGYSCLQLANLYQSINRPDSSLHYAQKALEAFKNVGSFRSMENAYKMISKYYGELKNTDSSYAYLKLATLLNDSLDRGENKRLQELHVAGFNEQLRLQQLEQENNQKIRNYAMLAGLGVFFIIGLLLYRNNRQKQKANVILKGQKEIVETALSQLKSTQTQLIQSEKLASLGELTAGIAHEIQNPLNFVNNFSEVSNELIDEMNEELSKGDIEEAQAISADIKQNLEKINHHGKRADAIVKGMLQHSQSSSGVKEPTDINALADEYLRLAYHGLRAKEKSFNATMKTEFDESIGSINIIPQDIGRVILNLITNAFYVVNEKSKQGITVYVPTVSVSTKKEGNKVLISVKDNGNGIPQEIFDKIFQPFFTTKPTGQGTGLGLSLSYDIVKAHGGELKIETTEGEGSLFIIELPKNT